MKKNREEQIVLDALRCAGCDITEQVSSSVSSALRQIRREKYEERAEQKAKWKAVKQARYYTHKKQCISKKSTNYSHFCETQGRAQ